MKNAENIILKKGAQVSLSCIGYNGFIYPGKKNATMLYDVEYKLLAWVGGGESHKPVLVPENSLAISGNPNKDIPVWIFQSK